VVGVVDPNRRVCGSGIDYLREHGVRVDVGVRGCDAERLNEAFLTWATRGQPFVTMKAATSRDGKIAARPGERTPLTSDGANEVMHRMRAEVDAIGVGSTTVLVDDPLLTARGVHRPRPLTRVVFDRRLRTPVTARVVGTLSHGPVIIFTTEGAVSCRPDLAGQLREAGVRLETMPDDDAAMGVVLSRLGALEVTSLLLEGGVTIHRAAWDAGLVGRVQQFVAPVELGSDGVSWLDLVWAELGDRVVRKYGPDTLKEGYVQRVD
jgi:diaminohydroxyphosphoribosylaminopyrimidine deaminase/5-amino-6-(5-phosphoribosylamino)uracil reductase